MLNISNIWYGSPPPIRKIFNSLEEMLNEYFSTTNDPQIFDFIQILKYNKDHLTIKESLEFYENNGFTITFNISKIIINVKAENLIKWLEDNAKWNDLSWSIEKDIADNQTISSPPLHNISILNLNKIFLSRENTTKLANWLRNNTIVTELYLVKNGLDNEKAIILADIFKTNRAIEKINLSKNYLIKEEGLKSLLNINKVEEILKSLLISFPEGIGIKNIFDLNFRKEKLAYSEDEGLKIKFLRAQDRNFEVLTPEVKSIFNLIMRGDNVIKKSYENLTIVIGADNSGKSTVIKLISNIQKLVPIYDNDNHTWSFEIINDLEKSKTTINSEKSNSNRSPIPFPKLPDPKIPTEFVGKDTIFMECPGIGNTIGNTGDKNIEHIIATKYYIWQMFNSTKSYNFLLTIVEEFFINADYIVALIKDFAEIFKDRDENKWLENIEKLKDSIALVVTHVEEGKTEVYIKNKIEKYIINESPFVKKYHQIIGNFLKDNISIFYKPTRHTNSNNNENNKISNLVQIKNPNKFVEAKHGNDYLTLPFTVFSESPTKLIEELYQQAINNISIINQIIVNFFNNALANLTDPFKSSYSLNLHHELDSTAFSRYWNLIKICFPQNVIHENGESITQKFYFTALAEIKKFKEILDVTESFRDSYRTSLNATEKYFNNDKATLRQYLETIRNFYGKEKTSEEILIFQKQINNYLHILNQQADIFKFFEKLNKFDVTNPFEKAIKDIKVTIDKMLIPAIKCMKLEPNQPIEYYKEAIAFLRSYPGNKNLPENKEIKKNLGKAHLYIGMNYIKMADDAIYNRENEGVIKKYLHDAGFFYKSSIIEYKTFSAYKELGNLLCRLNEDEAIYEAMKYYKIINYHIGIENCFSLLESNNKNNIGKLIDIKILQAQYAAEEGQTRFAREHLTKAKDLANGNKMILAKINIEEIKTFNVDQVINTPNNNWVQKNYTELRTGKIFDYSKVSNNEVRETFENIIEKFLPNKLPVANLLAQQENPLPVSNNNNAASVIVNHDQQVQPQTQENNDNANPINLLAHPYYYLPPEPDEVNGVGSGGENNLYE